MTVDFDTLKWVVPTVLAVLSFSVGGGWPIKVFRRTLELDERDRLRDKFLTREEHDAFVRSYEAWKQRVHEDFLEPFRTQTQALFNQGIAIARQGESLSNAVKAIDGLSDRVGELTDEVRTARKA